MAVSWQEQALDGDVGEAVSTEDRFGLELALTDLRRSARVLSALALKGFDLGFDLTDVQDPVEDVIAACYRAVEALTKAFSS